MKEYVKFYTGLAWVLKLILAIIPITGWVNAVLYRIGKGHLVSGIFSIFFGFIFWIIDLVTVLMYGKPVLFAS